MNRISFAALLFLGLLFMFSSCQDDGFLLKEKKSIPEIGWSYDVPVDFNFEIADTSHRYDLYLTIDHNKQYAFQNIYFKVITRFPSGKEEEEVLSINVSDHRGTWNGKCRGEKCELTVYLQEKIRFDETGQYRIAFEQYTREENLKYISKIGLNLQDRTG